MTMTISRPSVERVKPARAVAGQLEVPVAQQQQHRDAYDGADEHRPGQVAQRGRPGPGRPEVDRRDEERGRGQRGQDGEARRLQEHAVQPPGCAATCGWAGGLPISSMRPSTISRTMAMTTAVTQLDRPQKTNTSDAITTAAIRRARRWV